MLFRMRSSLHWRRGKEPSWASSGEGLDHAVLTPPAGASSCFVCTKSRDSSSLLTLCKHNSARFDDAVSSACEWLFSLLPTSPSNYLDGRCISIRALTLAAKCHKGHQEPGFYSFFFFPIAEVINAQPCIPLNGNHNT